MRAIARMNAVDGATAKGTYKTERGLAAFIEKWTGCTYRAAKTHYVADDGVSVVDIEWDERPEAPADEPEIEAPADDEPRTYTISCSECDNEWDITQVGRPENVRCRKCGAWCIVRLHPDLERYVRGLGVTASGNSTLDIADETADTLRGLDLPEMYHVLADELIGLGLGFLSKANQKALGTDASHEAVKSYFVERWGHRNAGMQRMNAGNVLRGARKRAREAVEGIE